MESINNPKKTKTPKTLGDLMESQKTKPEDSSSTDMDPSTRIANLHPVEQKMLNKTLSQICAKTGLSKNIMKDDTFKSTLEHVIGTIQKYRIEDLNSKVELPLIDTHSKKDAEKLKKFRECLAKYNKK